MKRRRITQKKKLKFSIVSCFVLSVFLFFFSVFSILDVINLNYEKLSKINSINNLKDSNDKLEIRLTSLKTSKNLKLEAASLGMVSVSSVGYINVGSESVVLNR